MKRKIQIERMYDVTVTAENVSDMLYKLIFELMSNYGPRVRDNLHSIAIGPNAYRWLEEYCIKNCRLPSFNSNSQEIEFNGITITCSSMPFAIPIFKKDGWYLAHELARNEAAKNEELDS
mgnify:CR=1 FL=1